MPESASVSTLFAIQLVYENTYFDVFLEITGAIFILCGFGVRLRCTLYGPVGEHLSADMVL